MPTSSRLATRPRRDHAPRVGSVMRLRIFNKVDLPAPFRPMMPSTSPRLTSKLTSFERPEFLDFVALHDLRAANEIERLARKIARFATDHVAQRRIALALARLMPDQIALREIFDGNDEYRTWLDSRRSDQIGKTLFHLPELADTKPQKKDGDADAEPRPGR